MIRSLILPTCCLGFTASFRMATTNAPSLYNYRQSSYSTTRHFSLSNTSSYSQEEAQIIQETLPSPLIDSGGNAFESAEALASLVEGQRVGLYFAASWCEDCGEIEFMLEQYRNALRDSDQPIQLIYVPCDSNQEDQLNQMTKLKFDIGVPLGETADNLKYKYGVWPDVDVKQFGGTVREVVVEDKKEDPESDSDAPAIPNVVRVSDDGSPKEVMEDDDSGRRSGIPAVVVLDNNGGELCFLNMERDTIRALADWPLDEASGHW
mmetsp:Transcript_11632/g.13176  ORF Transcript_11632/g.13176 Transcript_11632/m.13176 type:complete len:264 (+) Transcript_11632:55-846(+)